jgi:hypothetical protein
MLRIVTELEHQPLDSPDALNRPAKRSGRAISDRGGHGNSETPSQPPSNARGRRQLMFVSRIQIFSP